MTVTISIFHIRKLLRKAAMWGTPEVSSPGKNSPFLLESCCSPLHLGFCQGSPGKPTRAPPKHNQQGCDGHVMWWSPLEETKTMKLTSNKGREKMPNSWTSQPSAGVWLYKPVKLP